jgi:hypothetical protein
MANNKANQGQTRYGHQEFLARGGPKIRSMFGSKGTHVAHVLFFLTTFLRVDFSMFLKIVVKLEKFTKPLQSLKGIFRISQLECRA